MQDEARRYYRRRVEGIDMPRNIDWRQKSQFWSWILAWLDAGYEYGKARKETERRANG